MNHEDQLNGKILVLLTTTPMCKSELLSPGFKVTGHQEDSDRNERSVGMEIRVL